MRWLRDATGRFPRRPHYDASELEDVSADLLSELRQLRHTGCTVVSTDDLSVLIEHHAADLDLFADLPAEFDGVTDFSKDARPRVRVAARLSSHSRFEHRLRTTLAHELTHVVLHNFIWWLSPTPTPDPGVAFDPERLSPRCAMRARAVDWMEWQANYCAGALLVPASEVCAPPEPVWERSITGRALIRAVQERFEVSAQVATIRLRQLGRLSERPLYVARSPVPRRW
ncbi:MAG TPA: ImmA/IrrE family metallo-endopeptidase [Chloroflexota bacterium]|jgi:hypothetical protein